MLRRRQIDELVSIRRRWRLIVAAAVAASLAAPAAPSAGQRGSPPRVLVSALETRVRATQGSYCWTRTYGDTAVGQCRDSVYPLPVRCRLAAEPAALVRINTRVRATRVSVGLVGQIDGYDFDYLSWHRSKRRPRGRRIWRFRLPGKVSNAAALDVSVAYKRGDSSNWAGLDTEACRSSTQP